MARRRPCCHCGNAIPYFGLLGQKAICCVRCKTTEMVDVVSCRCRCGKSRPSFGLTGHKAVCCGNCKTANMVDVRSPHCRCGKAQPSFGLTGHKAVCCDDCKTVNMVNVRCSRCQCGKAQPKFALPGQKATCCSCCKTTEMVDVVSCRCRCGKSQPNFGLPGERALCCVDCKDAKMSDIVSPLCNGDACLQSTRVKKKGDLCGLCRKGTKIVKEQEAMVAGWLEEWSFHPSSHDRPVVECQGQATRKRPDFLFVIPGKRHVVILEVDENHHSGAAVSCEMSRMAEIKNGLPGGGIIFVRFNPAKSRKDALKEQMELALQSDGNIFEDSPYGVHVVYVGYPADRIADMVADPEYKFTYENYSDMKRRGRKRKADLMLS